MERTVIDTKVTCDGCGKDLTTTDNSVDYLLALMNQSLPTRGPVVTDLGIRPKIKRDCHFCGIRCLRKWLDEEHPVPR